jgi:hypothetical protein
MKMESVFNVSPKVLKAMSLFASDDPERFNLTGLYFRWNADGGLDIVGTDGHCLGSWHHVPHDEDLVRDAGSAVIPIAAFLPLINEASKKQNLTAKPTVELRIDRGKVGVYATLSGDVFMSMKAQAIDVEFPSWQAVIPSEDRFKPIPKLGVNPGLVKRFRDAARLIAPNPDGEAIVGLRFTGEKDTIEIKIGGAEEQFVGYLMPAMLMGKWVPALKEENEGAAA